MIHDFFVTQNHLWISLNGKTLPNKAINLGEKYGEIPLVTIGDCAFLRHSWLLKPYPDTTRNEKEKLFNLKLRSARVTTENCYGMVKSRFRIIYKQIEVKKHNLRYVIMSCIMLHNLCIHVNDPCNPRWQLEVEHLPFTNKYLNRGEDKEGSFENSRLITEWLWD